MEEQYSRLKYQPSTSSGDGIPKYEKDCFARQTGRYTFHTWVLSVQSIFLRFLGIFVCPSAELHNQADDYARLIASLAGFAKVDIVEKYASDKQQSVMSRTFGSCSVILPTAERVDRQSELTNIQKKLKKLKAKLESLEATVSHPSFAQSAPLHVQEVKRKQVNELKCEIENLQRIVERIVAK